MPENWLIFIDTNIFLDFYSLGGERADKQLKSLERHKDKLIISDQVRMEFYKNRQGVILKSLTDLKSPQMVSVPPSVSHLKDAEILIRNVKEAQKRSKSLVKKIDGMLATPNYSDHVFQTFNRIFDTNSSLNLCRPKKERFEIRNLARKRFILGYPPRKDKDNTIGDALHWEWIIKCAQNSQSNENILIVSRDSDFGKTHNKETYLNDWLLREFKERVGKRQKIELTQSLNRALTLLNEIVTEADKKAESKIIYNRLVSIRKTSKDAERMKLLTSQYLRNKFAHQKLSGNIVEDDDEWDPFEDD